MDAIHEALDGIEWYTEKRNGINYAATRECEPDTAIVIVHQLDQEHIRLSTLSEDESLVQSLLPQIDEMWEAHMHMLLAMQKRAERKFEVKQWVPTEQDWTEAKSDPHHMHIVMTNAYVNDPHMAAIVFSADEVAEKDEITEAEYSQMLPSQNRDPISHAGHHPRPLLRETLAVPAIGSCCLGRSADKIAAPARIRVTETRCLSLAVVAISKAPSIKSSDPKVKTFGYTAGEKQPQTDPAFSAKKP